MDETEGLILAAMENNPNGMTINEVSEYLMGMGYHTVQKTLLTMAKDGKLIQLPRRRGREIVYIPPGIFSPPSLTAIRFFSSQSKETIFEIITKLTKNHLEPDFITIPKQGVGPLTIAKLLFQVAREIRLDKMAAPERLSKRQPQLYNFAMALRIYQRSLLRQLEVIDDLIKTKELWAVDTIDQVIFDDPSVPVVFPKMADELIQEMDNNETNHS